VPVVSKRVRDFMNDDGILTCLTGRTSCVFTQPQKIVWSGNRNSETRRRKFTAQ
jgi:hypothetical protein